MNEIVIAADIIIALVLILLNAFFVLAEFSLVKVRTTRLELLSRQGNKTARLAQKAVESIDDYLSAIQLGITMASLGLGWIGEPAVAKIVSSVLPGMAPGMSSALSHSIALVCAFVGITSMHVILGEQVPKLIAIKSPDRILLWTAPPLAFFYHLTYLPMKFLNKSAYAALRLMGISTSQKEAAFSEEEMRMILAQSQEQGKLSLGRLLMFENLFDFGRSVVKEIMTPRESVAYFSLAKSWDENLDISLKKRYSRYPLCSNTLDDAQHYILIKDLSFQCMTGHQSPDLGQYRRDILFLEETFPLERALKEFQDKRLHLALVKNAEGKVSGLVTIEDVIEELVGEIRDESETSPPLLLRNILVPEACVLNLSSRDRFVVLDELLSKMHAQRPVFNKQEVRETLIKREKAFSFALGHGTAFPHARIESIKQPLLSFARSPAGLNFPSMDKEPVQLVFLILTPFNDPSFQLKILSQLASLVLNHTLRKKLLQAATPQEVADILKTFERKVAL